MPNYKVSLVQALFDIQEYVQLQNDFAPTDIGDKVTDEVSAILELVYDKGKSINNMTELELE